MDCDCVRGKIPSGGPVQQIGLRVRIGDNGVI